MPNQPLPEDGERVSIAIEWVSIYFFHDSVWVSFYKAVSCCLVLGVSQMVLAKKNRRYLLCIIVYINRHKKTKNTSFSSNSIKQHIHLSRSSHMSQFRRSVLLNLLSTAMISTEIKRSDMETCSTYVFKLLLWVQRVYKQTIYLMQWWVPAVSNRKKQQYGWNDKFTTIPDIAFLCRTASSVQACHNKCSDDLTTWDLEKPWSQLADSRLPFSGKVESS